MAKSSKKGKQHNILYLIFGIVMLAFAVLSAISTFKSSYDKAVIQEVTRTYDKKRSGSNKRNYYADVVVSLEYNGQQTTADTTVKVGSRSSLPAVGDTIDVQITDDGRVIASTKGKSILMSVVGLLAGGLLIWFSISNILDAKKKEQDMSKC